MPRNKKKKLQKKPEAEQSPFEIEFPYSPPPLKNKAPVQVTFANKQAMELARPNVGDGSIYNIWYNKWYSDVIERTHAQGASAATLPFSRCHPERDSGLTKADSGITQDPFFCIFFAKGCCGKGPDCYYLHRIPYPKDEEHIEKTRDCFGRERHRVDKDNMQGVGSFERDNTTLYVGCIGNYPTDEIEKVLRKHFGKFGKVIGVRQIPSRNMAFVQFSHRMSAEFAKEAMYAQALDKNEVLSVKWATEDALDPQQMELKNRVESQQIFLEKLLKNPENPLTRAFLHDTQTEGDLNRFYQQQQHTDYLQFQKKHQWAPLVQQSVEEQEVIEPITKKQKVLVYDPKSENNHVPPPPPKPKIDLIATQTTVKPAAVKLGGLVDYDSDE